ncbi:MAG: thioether cross-link-forming SCIFF peptide maturase [Lachnospiraceae bacterium]|nr:thioether cross-link-forming SCIFF peptide maturase [Lachnospiraceae bacterium]
MVHVFQNNGMFLALDIESGSVYALDEVMYEILRRCPEAPDKKAKQELSDRFSPEELSEAWEEIEELVNEGALYTPPADDGFQKALLNRRPVVKALCLHIAHDCNLACKYCFAGEGEYHGKRSLMSAEVGRAALDFLVKSSGARKNLEVDFFGGEPTLNFEVVKELVAYGRELEKTYPKHFRFTLTTNGVLLDEEIMEFANREMDNVVLSIDGRKETHDRMRPNRGGGGSYDTVLPKFKKMAALREQDRYYVRGTFTRNNPDFAEDVLHLADLGFKRISVEPVVAPESAPYSLREEDVPGILKEYDRLAAEMKKRIGTEKEFLFFHFMIDLEGGPCALKRLSGCGSGTDYLAVTPEGELYPCHQFVGIDGFRMGDVRNGVEKPEIADKFAEVNVFSKEECASCFARYYCSGGCAANAWNCSGDIKGTYNIGCELEKKRVECALMLKAAEAGL